MRNFNFDKLNPRHALDLSGSQGIADTAKSTGENAINSFNPTTTAGAQQQNTNNLFNTQQGQTKSYINDYSNAVANNPKVQDLYQQGNSMFNVPALQTQATQLQNRVTNAVPDGYQGARGFDIPDSAIQNGIASKTAYLLPQANAATANANTAAGLASNFVQAGQTQNAQNLLPIQAEQANLLQSQGLQGQGWNQAAQQEFQGLMDKMDQGIALSSQEYQRANQLAAMEEDYQKQAGVNATTLANTIQGQKYQTVPAGQNLVNTFAQGILNPATGQVRKY